MPPAPAPSDLLDLLRRHLEQELAAHRRLLHCAHELAAPLVGGDSAGIARAVAAHEEANREAARLAAQRQRLCQALAQQYRLSGSVTLGALLPHAAAPLRQELERLRDELQSVCQRLTQQSERNLAVARQGLALIREVLGGAAGQQPAAAYDRRGFAQAPPPPRGALLDLRH